MRAIILRWATEATVIASSGGFLAWYFWVKLGTTHPWTL